MMMMMASSYSHRNYEDEAAQETNEDLTNSDFDESSNEIVLPCRILPTPKPMDNSTPKQKRVGVGVSLSPSAIWGITFLALILFSEALSSSSPSPLGGNRRRVRGTAGRLRHYSISSSPSTPTTTFDLEESKRLLRLESASPISYLYRYRAPRTIAPSPIPPPTQPTHLDLNPSVASSTFTSRSQPRVLLRLNGQSGIIQRRSFSTMPAPTLPAFPTTSTPTPFSSEKIEKSEQTAHPHSELRNVVEENDYPYHYYLDFDENKSSPPQKEYLYPQPSEHLKPYALPETQSSLWNEFLHHSQTNNNGDLSTTGATPPSYLNEINDNYTIPSLRDYKFPEFKTVTTTTTKPPKHNFLNPYEFFSEEDLENVADLDFDSDHSKYFVRTKPRDVSSSVANLYNSFYYEPPSYSTKSQPLPVKATFPQQQQLTNGGQLETNDNSKVRKWSRVGNNDFNFNYFDGSTLVTFPMSPTPFPDTTTDISSYQTTTTSSQLPSTTPSTNLSEYYFNLPKSEAAPRNDVATAESVAILASKSSLNLNLIPHTFVHKELLDTDLHLDTTTPKMDLIQHTTTPSSGSDQDTTNIPGMPGIDYPIFDEIPVTGFDCTKQRYKGFFADIASKCQVWHYCDFADGHSSFLCQNGTLFSQALLTCDWWFNVDCNQSQQLYVLNERLYRYIKPPKPSFPEDYHGPGVDLWLKKQLELGLLPRIKKRGKHVDKPVPTTLKEKVVLTNHDEMSQQFTSERFSSLEDEKNR